MFAIVQIFHNTGKKFKSGSLVERMSKVYCFVFARIFCQSITPSPQGDSGGPLQCETPEGIYVLAGSTSWGTKCAEAGKPSVFAKIAKQVDWIHSVAGPTP